jgi:hypothetical protein
MSMSMFATRPHARFRSIGEPTPRRRRALRPLLALLGALLATGAVPAAALAHVSNNRVLGVQSAPITSGRCFDANEPASYTMAGSLVGCWYVDTFIVTKSTTRHGTVTIHASGTEHFVGCLDVDRNGRCANADLEGTLAFTYTFVGQFDAATGDEIWGRCHHPIVSGTGDFARATGALNFRDHIVNGTLVDAPYRGHIKV